jgi:hypothetical protein
MAAMEPQRRAAQVHGFHRPMLVLNPRSGSALAVREQLLAAAGRYGVQLHEAETPAELVALARAAVADGADRPYPSAASAYRLRAAIGANREYWPWNVTVTVSVGPLRCLARMKSASPLRADSGS